MRIYGVKNGGRWSPPARRTRLERAHDVARFACGILVYSTAYLLCVLLALATLARMASVSAGLPDAPVYGLALLWWPVIGWLVASALVLALRIATRVPPALETAQFPSWRQR